MERLNKGFLFAAAIAGVCVGAGITALAMIKNGYSKNLSNQTWTQKSRKHKRYLNTPIVLCEDVRDYGDAIRENCAHHKFTDAVELGCADGKRTKILVESQVPNVLGVDKGTESITKAKARYADDIQKGRMRIEQMDASDPWPIKKALLSASSSQKSSTAEGKENILVCVDLSGNQNPGALVEILKKYEIVMMPTMFIVKNYPLRHLWECSSVSGMGPVKI